MSSLWNHNLKVSIFGESHGKGIGVVIDGLPPGEDLSLYQIKEFMARRAPKPKEKASTTRRELDNPNILSGILDNKTTGAPLCAIIENTDTRSGDYKDIQTIARPGHADYTADLRYKGYNDIRGSGHFSGRLTAPLVFAGAVCAQILQRRSVYVGAHIYQILDVMDTPFDSVCVQKEEFIRIQEKKFAVICDDAGRAMQEKIAYAFNHQDSVGGIIECIAVGFPAGIGSPMFDGLENTLASILFGIPAVKGVEFGAGFDVASLYGSQNNDDFYMDGDTVRTKTNNHGGILGGISSGMPICLRVAVKPTASISTQQHSINYKTHKDTALIVKGRHDACIVPRAVPVVEAAVNIALLSQLLS